MGIAISSDRNTAATGQVGSNPTVFTWDATTGQKQQRFKLGKGCRGVAAVALSQDGSLVAAVDLHNEHNLHVWDTSSGALVLKAKGDTNKIHDVCFSAQPGSTALATAGTKHIYFWDAKASGGDKKRGLFGSNPMTSFACVAYDADGNAYTGGSNSKVYVWRDREVQAVIEGHGKGFICSIRWVDGKLFSGGKDGCICEIDTASHSVVRKFDFGNLIRAIDYHNGQLLVGTRNGTITVVEHATDARNEIMHSHNEGEVWGLQTTSSGVITSGDDNQVLFWNPQERRREKCVQVSERTTKSKRGGASTLSHLPDSKCSRAVACNGDWLAVAGNDGAVSIRSASNCATECHLLTDSSEWIEILAFSPDGTKLAAGSHDNCTYLYDTSNWSLCATLKGHSSYIMALDWSADGQYIRTNCGAYELLFFCAAEGWAQDKNGRSNTTGTEWATHHVKFSWSTEGIYPKGTDGTHVNGVDRSKDGCVIATGDDYGLVNIFRNPVRNGGIPRSFRGHSEHVVRVAFNDDDSYLYSVGGYDQTLMQWRRC